MTGTYAAPHQIAHRKYDQAVYHQWINNGEVKMAGNSIFFFKKIVMIM